MDTDVERAKHTFVALLTSGARHEAIIEVLTSLRTQTQLDPDDTGWVLWNICDRYALLRQAPQQYRYQAEFWDWCRGTFSTRLHWVVSDATQALTLISGGYMRAWWRWYEQAARDGQQTAENRGARFESHRANAHAYIRFGAFEQAETALSALGTLRNEDATWANQDFATVTYRALLVEYHAAREDADQLERQRIALEDDVAAWCARAQLHGSAAGNSGLLGSWAQLNAERPSGAIVTAVNNAACSLVRAACYQAAERFFQHLLDHGTRLNAFAQVQFLRACWHNRHDRAEIRERLRAAADVTPAMLEQHGPELVWVLGPD